MTTGNPISPTASTALSSQSLQEQREFLRHRLLDGATGGEVVQAFSDFMDGLLMARFREVIQQGNAETRASWQQCCLVAMGGYGRRELAPYSDIDVMVLTRGNQAELAQAISQGVFHRLWDLGFQVGHSVRTIAECLEIGETDLPACTSLMESRFLGGNAAVFQEFQRKFDRRILKRRAKQFVLDKIEERQREYAKFGGTIFLLEPNIKKGKGGLRDVHLIQWVGQARFGAGTIQELSNQGILALQDYQVLQEAQEFLWRLRGFLHFEAKRAQDILTFDDQVRLAEIYELSDLPNLLAVEQFMQQYFRHTTGLHDRCLRFLEQAEEQSWVDRIRQWWPTSLLEGTFLIEGSRLTIPPEKLLGVLESPVLLLRIFELSHERALTIDSQVLNELSQHLATVPNELFHTEEVSLLFRGILRRPGRIGQTLEAMHQAGLLEKLVPAFARVRGLMQFNQYHKYTVDEHSLLAVKEAERLQDNQGITGEVYRKIEDKDILHLALLLHDLGKGRPGDHCKIGQELAHLTADRLGLSHQEREVLAFLVFHHLVMSHTAFRRDLNDQKIILTFGRKMKTVGILQKMFILTVADISAVGPEVMTKWKESLLGELYSRTYEALAEGQSSNAKGSEQGILKPAARKSLLGEMAKKVGEDFQPDADWTSWVDRQLSQLPDWYLTSTPIEEMAAHLLAMRNVSSMPTHVEGRFNQELGVSEYVLITQTQAKPGLFMQVTGVLAAFGLEVLNAQIMTVGDGIVLDIFSVNDTDCEGSPSEFRFQEVAQEIQSVVQEEYSVEQVFERRRRLTFGRQFPSGRRPTEVLIDNEVSDSFTVIDVFADDKSGLLFLLGKTLVQLDLSIHMARIGTRLDQVVDVFYVTTSSGEKIQDAAHCKDIQLTIQKSVDAFLNEGS
ncbi:MAG: [protein-PII] uridylyltransferase [Nitrospirota bacterium]|nr:[protein-PII] uridylyltransferase [Nitrospirota bacterium]MDH5586291.1 [protein-PII] uridylyltransferase [Nitrospirota bacterium]MDH5773743.1 [protein-PII] uridylyltransferase [Nitrospirota bacterium]